MSQFWIKAVVIFTFLTFTCVENADRIVGGEVTTINAFPYQVSLRYFGSHTCGGSILNDGAILTAAHCVNNLNPRLLTVQYGVNSILSLRNVLQVKSYKRHPDYNEETVDFDIAIVFLTGKIPFSSVAQPIALADENPLPGTTAVVTGWGLTTENGISSYFNLRKVEVDIISNTECADAYKNRNDITDRMICAGVDNGGKDSCQGDSGGPLAANGVQVGVVSFGLGCGRKGFPGVYASVSSLRNWIDDNL